MGVLVVEERINSIILLVWRRNCWILHCFFKIDVFSVLMTNSYDHNYCFYFCRVNAALKSHD